MKKIGLMSDTHSYLHPQVFKYFEEVDEIWHAGDIGNVELADKLEAFKPFRAVYGNIDGADIRIRYPEILRFNLEEVEVMMTHIGGYPGKYAPGVREILKKHPPKLFICGHSHILKVMPDPALHLLHMNPGACGQQGWHKVKTLLRFQLDNGNIQQLEVIELP
ncbi:metallophosphoesterase family protein [Chitinophaga polysaccharea]|uniref:metallophosphoesterase family protein n=1 Tax=Chitinophaga TaxID=79328 RepID=UPI0014550B05|nr:MULTISPECIES: metallophosphoesterase family protein [Chitinophaga]NLR57138.1 metallophosphoesterase family protein [Chitinophaga polysaccharea]NLU91737.1 metallophosphoesterase family protein [Chitinophaga sp. Ak27]